MANMKSTTWEHQAGILLASLGQPIRIQILSALAAGEACVCHLESLLGKRQAYISQHLMALRQAGILVTRREGRFIFYRLADSKYLDLLLLSSELAGTDSPALSANTNTVCNCPHCETAT
jgi:ArsR family transcriptional regulator